MKRTALLLVCLFLLGCQLAPMAGAATTEAIFDDLDSERDIVLWVSWPTEQPDIVFIAPDGTRYDPTVESESTTTIFGENELFYIIYSAPAGQWRVSYDKKGNDEIEISMHNYNPGLTISEFNVGTLENDRIPVTFTVSGEERSYAYRISAVIDRSGGEKVLATGNATAGREVSVNVRLNSLASYSSYMLKLYVWFSDGETDYFDFTFSEPFAYTNTTVSASMSDFEAVIEPETQTIYVAWPDLDWSAERVMVALFEDGASEPVTFDEYDPDEYDEVQLSYDPAATRVDVELSVQLNGIYATTLRKSMDLASFGLQFPEGDAVASTNYPMTYSGFQNQLVSVTVNERDTSLQLTGDGQVTLHLSDDWNEVVASYTDAQNVTWRLNRRVFVDRIAPVLRMAETYDGMVTEQTSMDILGTVLDYAGVSINGAPVTVDENGAFRHTVTLQSGENELLVTAVDALGNEAQYQAVITCTAGGYQPGQSDPLQPNDPGSEGEDDLLTKLLNGDHYIALAIAGGLCILIVLYAFLFWRKGGSDQK